MRQQLVGNMTYLTQLDSWVILNGNDLVTVQGCKFYLSKKSVREYCARAGFSIDDEGRVWA